ncbi:MULTISPECIES: ABC transporter permease [Paracoccus]|uniref:NitT/TauT family transport system permease protein n=1 Tax=Paracoccus versutus TaxID=34007 RepID=A0A369U985_PARVE|nr:MULTISPECIES: ABC transporter permease subunit [Paracoccus]MBT0782148.1 ABC transporter permease subunit [Paracoccus sp. pheM1]WGR63384.1 ABC transporter permease subunit [Paracoccus ferrooxidans]SFY41292.1 NitT/TauT family transport system permease protein [Paracoccus pantotrophus]MCJ1901744.1 ABC transporter permease subunit [Paracoccus versutus]MDF3906602.1 ABC transporter permease subunit [Paracoccus sp. AS002]
MSLLSACLDRLARLGRFLWSAWAGLAGLALIGALWQAGHEAYGDFILTAPLDTLAAAARLMHEGRAQELLALTTARALAGFGLCALIGTLFGVAAGYSPATLRLSRPILTLLLGVPPIAWIVLAMIWFGPSDLTVAVTILISATPVVFVGAVEGVVTRDRGLDDMAQVFGAGPLRRFLFVSARQISAQLFPALILALGSAFKVAIMAELLANAGGIGGALARARAMLDIAEALAWVSLAVAALIAVEYVLIRPVRAELERWREAAAPWGVKR